MLYKQLVVFFLAIVVTTGHARSNLSGKLFDWHQTVSRKNRFANSFGMRQRVDVEDSTVDQVKKLEEAEASDVNFPKEKYFAKESENSNKWDNRDFKGNQFKAEDNRYFDVPIKRESATVREDAHREHTLDNFAEKEASEGKDSSAENSLLHYNPSLGFDRKESDVHSNFDNNSKKHLSQYLVDKAVGFLNEQSVEEALHVFNHTKHFFKAGQYVFVYDQDGICLADLYRPEMLWKNNYNMQESYGKYPIQELIKKGNEGGGWVEYVWQGSATEVYVKRVIKNNKAYYLSCGFFTHEKYDAVLNLVKSGGAFFKKMLKQGMPAKVAFASLGYKGGNFFQGDLHLYIVSYDGLMVAHGAHPEYVGANVLDAKNHEGEYENKIVINALNKSPDGAWVEFKLKNSVKKVYAEKIKDRQGNKYFIACGYYPDADRSHVVELVRKAYGYMKTHGKAVAIEQFIGQSSDLFEYGDLYITVYSEKGICIADGKFYDDIGQDFINKQDDEGYYFVRQIIEKSKIGGGWINYKKNNLYHSVYIQPIDIGVEKLIITSGVYPVSRKDTMMLMVKSAIGHLETVSFAQSMRDFVKLNSKFRRGDLEVFVFDTKGMCYAYGSEYDLIWRNLMQLKNEDGLPFIKKIIKVAEHGPSLVNYSLNGAKKVAYVESVKKDDKTYIVGSGYYL